MTRNSNLELLRIISMLMILGIHADFYSIESPFIRYFIDALINVGVNCFILISGYFGIKPTVKKGMALLFTVVFYQLAITLCFSPNANNVISSFYPFKNYWFVNSYFALFVFSPILNAFIDKAENKEYVVTLVAWAIISFMLGYVTDYLHFNRGYSFQSFILLYLIAAYIRKYPIQITSFHKSIDLVIYLGCTIITTLLFYSSSLIGKIKGAEYYLRAYNSPCVILGGGILIPLLY